MYIAILAVLSGVLMDMLLSLYRFKALVEDRVNVNEDLRVLVKSIRDDMYLGRTVRVDTGNVLVITNPAGIEVSYYLQSGRVYRQQQSQSALTITGSDVNVVGFSLTDLSTPDAAGTVQIDLILENFPQGLIKPLVREELSSTVTLKFV